MRSSTCISFSVFVVVGVSVSLWINSKKTCIHREKKVDEFMSIVTVEVPLGTRHKHKESFQF